MGEICKRRNNWLADQIRILGLSHYSRQGDIVSRLVNRDIYEEGGRKLAAMLKREKAYNELLEWYLGVFGSIESTFSIDLNIHIMYVSTLLRMVYECDKNNQICNVKSNMLNYSTYIFLCTIFKKTISSIYKSMKNKSGNSRIKASDFYSILKDDEGVFRDIFTSRQLKNYFYFFSQIKKYDYSLDSMSFERVSQVLYLYTDLLNSLLVYSI